MDEEELDEAQTKYTIETTDRYELNLYINVYKLISALDDIKEFRRNLYKGYYNDVLYMTKGYKYERLEKKDIEIKEGDSICVMNVDKIIDEIDYMLKDVSNLLDD